MSGPLQTDIQLAVEAGHFPPGAVGQGVELGSYPSEKRLDQRAVPGDADPQGVIQNQGQEFGGGLATVDRSLESSCDQVRYAADMIDVAVGDEQGLDGVFRKGELRHAVRFGSGGALGTLELSAIDQHRVRCAQAHFMA